MKKKLFFVVAFSLPVFISAQNVGINTINPQATLDVRGNQRFGGATQYLSYDSLSGKVEWRNSYLYVPVSQALMKHSAAADGLFYNNSGGVNGQMEYRDASGNPVFYTNFTNGYGYFKSRLGIATINPLAGLHVADSSVLFSASGTVPFIPETPPIQGEGRRMMWYSNKAAFRAGYVNSSNWDKDSIGNYSVALGYNTKASGTVSIAMGINTTASGFNSTAMGYFTTASGYNSTAMGYFTTASSTSSTATGYVTTAAGDYATAMGFFAIASGYASTAMGAGTIAKSNSEMALGSFNTDYSPISADWYPTDRLFGVGNGVSSQSRSDALVILKNGNTGIGNSTPGFPLSFSTAIGDKISLWSNSSNSYGFGIQGSLLQIHTDISAADIAFGYGSSSSFFETMRIKGNGILQFPSTFAKKITFYSGTTGDVGFGVQGNQLLIYADHPAAMVRLGYDQAGMFTNNLDVYGNGNAWLRGTLTQASDSRLKKDINLLQNSLEKITLLNGYNYYWRNENADSSLQTGLLAQEVRKLFPELVKEDNEGMLSVNYSGLIPVLIESIKQQQQMIGKQQLQINELIKMMEKTGRKE